MLSAKAYGASLKISELLFSSLTELQYVTALTVVVMLGVLDRPLVSVFVFAIRTDLRILLFPIAALYLVFVMFKKDQLSDNAKLWACLLYYGFFAALALVALHAQHYVASKETISFEAVNYWLTKGLLVLALARGIVCMAIFRIDNSKLDSLVTQNFRNTQYHPGIFIYAAAVTAGTMVLLRHVYSDPAALAILSFTYANAVLMITVSLFRSRVEY